MFIAVNYQLSAFGQFAASPSSKNIVELMQKFSESTGIDFLPNIITSQQVEIPANRVTTISNLGFIANNQQYNVSILNERIDITYVRVKDDIDVECFYNNARIVLGIILDYFKVKSNRLATNIEYIIPAEIVLPDTLYNKLINTPFFTKDKRMLEWSYRTNILSTVLIKETEEKLNTIISLSTASDQQKQQIVVCHLDINTMPLLTNLRFSSDDLESYVAGTLSIAKQIANDMEAMINSDS